MMNDILMVILFSALWAAIAAMLYAALAGAVVWLVLIVTGRDLLAVEDENDG